MNEEQKFFKLLRYSNELRKNKKSLLKKDPKVFDVFLHFLVRIERNLHYSEKQEYIELAKDFLADQITADDFSYAFMGIYEGISGSFRTLIVLKNSSRYNLFFWSFTPNDFIKRTFNRKSFFDPERRNDFGN